MEKYLKDSLCIEYQGVFDKDKKRRFEFTVTNKGKKSPKSILVIGLNPASSDISRIDTTTNFILNNLQPMGYTTITICNLYAQLCKKLKPSEIINNVENLNYIEDVLKRDFETILIGYGNSNVTSKILQVEKKRLLKLLTPYESKVKSIVDIEERYSALATIHPLMAGRYFSGKWKLVPYHLEKDVDCEAENTAETEN